MKPASGNRLFNGISVLVLITSLIAGCSKTTPSPPTVYEVHIHNSVFSPATVNATINSTVKWFNDDTFEHTVTSNTGSFDSGPLKHDSTYSVTFKTGGNYLYYCALHQNETGTVVVK